jgi:hypothetical protein
MAAMAKRAKADPEVKKAFDHLGSFLQGLLDDVKREEVG